MIQTQAIDIFSYHLVDMNTFILLVKSQVIWNRITGFKSEKYPQVHIQGKNRVQGAVHMMRLARLCIKGAP